MKPGKFLISAAVALAVLPIFLLFLGLWSNAGIRFPLSNTKAAISFIPRLGAVKPQIEELFSEAMFEKLALTYANVFLISATFLAAVLLYILYSDAMFGRRDDRGDGAGAFINSEDGIPRFPWRPVIVAIAGSIYLLYLILLAPQVMPVGNGISNERALWAQYAVFILFGLFNLSFPVACLPIIRAVRH